MSILSFEQKFNFIKFYLLLIYDIFKYNINYNYNHLFKLISYIYIYIYIYYHYITLKVNLILYINQI